MAHRRVFTDQDTLVEALRVCRTACIAGMRDMPITGEAGATYRATETFLSALDDYVGVLTGDRTALQMKLHGGRVVVREE